MKKYLLTFEFRYYKLSNRSHSYRTSTTKTITIGVYETLKEAVTAGNEKLSLLKGLGYEIRDDDKFKEKGLFGAPDTLITNTCYAKGKAQYFGKITTLDYADLLETESIVDKEIKALKAYELENLED